jgi:hypothetical protein
MRIAPWSRPRPTNKWNDSFGALIDAAGGLAAAVRASYELEAAEKAKQIEGQVVKQVPNNDSQQRYNTPTI